MVDQQQWEHDGYLVLRGAAPREALRAYPGELAALRDGLLVRAPGDEYVSLAAHAEPGSAGAVDPYAISEAARAVLLPEPVVAALRALWDAQPLLFDAVEALAGAPDPGPYRDATFVATSGGPATLITAVVALGDAVAVTVFPGSHRAATTPFSGHYHHFNPERDGEDALERHRDEIATAISATDGTTVTLEAGDVLLWHAELIHAPIAGDATALLAHLCPAGVQPGWFAYRPERARWAAAGDAWIATQHYDLVDAVDREPPAEDYDQDAESERELETVEDALRAHDDRPPDAPAAPPPGPNAHRRAGGLLNSVRGIMGRRGRR
ncbi:MAG TPA: phytanoyl-CoA dioxygenase family protein [Baekduia sp.]|jgi:hypothetical protein|nr:phytanoyl-CoA dioxygenase family protein [Baekduia sp.]